MVFEIGVTGRQLDGEALLLQAAVKMLSTASVIACEKDKGNR